MVKTAPSFSIFDVITSQRNKTGSSNLALMFLSQNAQMRLHFGSSRRKGHETKTFSQSTLRLHAKSLSYKIRRNVNAKINVVSIHNTSSADENHGQDCKRVFPTYFETFFKNSFF